MGVYQNWVIRESSYKVLSVPAKKEMNLLQVETLEVGYNYL